MSQWLAKGCVVAVGVLLAFPASAQEAQQLFNFFLDQATQEIDRQQRIEQQRQQQLYDLFVAEWHSCGAGDITACDQALAYPGLSARDRRTLKKQRAALIEAKRQSITVQQEQERQAERERLEREDQARQEAARAAERDRQVEAARVEQAHLEELARQKAEVERLAQQRLVEERRIADMRAFADLREACRAYDIRACTTAFNSPYATDEDRVDFIAWRQTAEQLEADLAVCAAQKSAAACDAALSSSALKPARRPQVAGWRAEASPLRTAFASVTNWTSASTSALVNLPASTQITGAVAALLGVMVLLLLRRRRAAAESAREGSSAPGWRKRLLSPLVSLRRWIGERKRPRKAEESTEAQSATASAQAPTPAEPPAPTETHAAPQLPAVIAPRDTPGALAAMELAHAYIEEIKGLGPPDEENKADLKQRLNTLSLAAKQLSLAERLDRDAVLEVQESDGSTLRWRVHELKSDALRLEGMTHIDTGKARAALEAATEADPESAIAFYCFGIFHAGHRNRTAAITALRRAVALNPKSVEFRMELDRAENLSGTEIAGFKVTRAGIKTYNAGVRTLNVFIICWNIFAITWNIITFPMRLVLRIAGHRL